MLEINKWKSYYLIFINGKDVQRKNVVLWTSQVYGHHDKMARTKHTDHNKTRSIQRRNRH